MVLATPTPMTAARNEAAENTGTGETGENSKDSENGKNGEKGEYLRTNLAQVYTSNILLSFKKNIYQRYLTQVVKSTQSTQPLSKNYVF